MPASGDIGRLLAGTRLGKYLKTATAEVSRLRDRVAQLRTAVAEPRVTEMCPACGVGRLRVVAVRREPMMGELGPQEFAIRCDNPDCGHTETRMHGYAAPVRNRRTD